MRLIENFLRIILPYLLAIFLFDYSLDIKIIDPGNINWLMSVYHDWGQHYLGWEFYRNEPWTFPLGEIANYNYPIGTNIGFTDSIPLLAIFFKLFRSILPEYFQYIGFWMFLSYILLAYYTLKILRLYKIDFFPSLIFIVFILTNPVLIYRAMHPALFSQWIIIAALFLYLKKSSVLSRHTINLQLSLLILSSALINPYLFAMIFAFSIILPAKQIFIEKNLEKKYILIYPIFNIFLVTIAWFLVGLISFRQSATLAVNKSYGLYGLNLNSLINSFGFSNYFPQLKQVSWHQYEGYAYLGIGIMLLITISLGLLLFKGKLNFLKIKNEYIGLIVLSLLLTLFSITGSITFGDKTLIQINLPSVIYQLGDIFRASARFFWLSYYLIFFAAFIYFSRSKIPFKLKNIILSILLIIQLLDINPILTFRHFEKGAYRTPLKEEIWVKMFKEFEVLCIYPPFENHLLSNMDYQDLDFLALKANKPITNGYVARENSAENQKFIKTVDKELLKEIDTEYLFITTARYLVDFRPQFVRNKIIIAPLDDYFLIYSKDKKLPFDLFKEKKQIIDSLTKEYSTPSLLLKCSEWSVIDSNLIYNIEEIYTYNNVLKASGWAYLKDANNNEFDSAFVTLSNKEHNFKFPLNRVIRNDLNPFYKRNDLQNAGFNFVILSDSIIGQTFELGFAFRENNSNYIYCPTSYQTKFNNIPKLLKSFTLADSTIMFNLETLKKEDAEIEISGWCFLPNQNSTSKHIKLLFIKENQMFELTTEKIIRPDVSQFFDSNYNMDLSGFKVNFKIEDLPEGNYLIAIAVFDINTESYRMKMTGQILENKYIILNHFQ